MSKLAGTPQPAAMESADNDSSDSEPPEVIEPIAKYRSRRANAGLKMSALISEQENSVLSTSVGEDVYTSAYGGFDDDDEIEFDPSAAAVNEEDIIDSDFTDQTDSDDDDDNKSDEKSAQPKRKKLRRHGVVTKAYREPNRKGNESVKGARRSTTTLLMERPSGGEQRQLRQSTQARTLLVLDKTKVKQPRTERPSAIDKHRTVTQAQRLAQAKKTEIENLRSLEQYQQMQIDQKRHRQRQMKRNKCATDSRVKYLSMRCVDDMTKCVTNKEFVECTDTVAYNTCFPMACSSGEARANRDAADKRRGLVCVVTGLPAKYIDPITLAPYANVDAFRTIRESYEQWLTQQGNGSDLK